MEDEKNVKTLFESSQGETVDEFDLNTNNGEPSGEWDLIIPETEVFAESILTRARSSSLKGKTIVLRRNDKPNSDIFLERVGALLTQNFEGVKILKAWEVVPGSDMAKPGVDSLTGIAALKPDLVISAQGD
jgi:hypothetical protein